MVDVDRLRAVNSGHQSAAVTLMPNSRVTNRCGIPPAAEIQHPLFRFLIPRARRSVSTFESIDLPAHWAPLDTFERPGYERVLTTVHMSTADVDASICVLVRGSKTETR
jgi:hypothetical protein